MARTSNFANVATVTRASTKTDAGGWDFTSGGTVGTLTEYASGVAAIHPTAGLLVEESTTNEIRNPRCEGAVAGSPGTLPTNWTFSMPGITGEVIGTGTEDGWPYLDYKVAGTPTGDGFMFFEPSTQIAAVSGETWTESVSMKLVGGDLTNMDGIRVVMFERSSGGSNLGAQQSDPIVVDSTHKRYFHTATLSNGSTAYVQPALEMEWDGAGAVDFTLRIYAPQLEEKAYPTSPVFPVAASPAAATRAADDVSIADGAWRNATQNGETIYAEFIVATTSDSGAGRSAGFAYLKPSSAAGRGIVVGYDRLIGEYEFSLRTDDATVNGYSVASGKTAGETARMALAWDGSQFSASGSGIAQGADQTISGDGFDAPDLWIGRGFPGGSFPTSGYVGTYIKDIRYWPKRLTNAELEALVGN